MRSRGLSTRTRFVLAALIATLPLVALVTYAAVDRYNSDRTRAETRSATRAQVFATVLAEQYTGRTPTRAELAKVVSLLPPSPGGATIVYDTSPRAVVRVGDPRATPGSAAAVASKLAAGNTTFHARGTDGTLRVWGLAPIKGTPYVVAFGSPGALIYGAAQSALRRELALALAAAIAALVAAFVLAGRVTRPVVRRSEELQGANEQLRAANAAKNEFLSRMSHELRTPLAAIMGFSELLASPTSTTSRSAGWR